MKTPDLISQFSALSNPHRLELMRVLLSHKLKPNHTPDEEWMTLSFLTQICSMSSGNACSHLTELEQANLVEKVRNGHYVMYRAKSSVFDQIILSSERS